MKIVLDEMIQPFYAISISIQAGVGRMRAIVCRGVLMCLALGAAITWLSGVGNADPADVVCSWTRGADVPSASVAVRNRPVEEVLVCLTQKFDLHYRSGADLTLQVTGMYEGSLRDILPRLLQGYNFFLRYSSAGRIELTILGEEKKSSGSKVEIKRDQQEQGDNAEPEFGG